MSEAAAAGWNPGNVVEVGGADYGGADVDEGDVLAGGGAVAAGTDREAAVGVGSGDEIENADASGEADDANPEPSGETHTVKVDGEELELTLDELKAGYSRAAAATRRFQEAAQQKREIQEFVTRLKGGDRRTVVSLLERVGVDFTKLAEEHLSEYLQDLDAPEHVRGMRELERKRAEFERMQQEAQQRQQEAQIEQEAARVRQTMQAEMQTALGKHGLPASPTIIAKVAKEMEMALVHDYPMTVADAAQIVAEETRLLLRKLPPDAAARLMGGAPAVAQAQRADAAKVAAAQKGKAAQVAKKPAQRRPPPRQVNPENMNDVKALFDS